MDIKDSKTWHDLIYNLLYPGILGSMIYNTSEFLRAAHSFDWFYLSQTIVVIFYAIDYLHLQADLKPASISSGFWAILDASIALLFGAVSWSMSREDFGRSFDLLVLIAFLVFIYRCPPNWRKSWYYLGKGFNLIVVIAAWFCSRAHGFRGGVYAAWVLAVIVFVYFLHVFVVIQLAKPESAQGVSPDRLHAR